LGTQPHTQTTKNHSSVKLEFHDTDTDILARILADTFDACDFLKLFLWQAERHADILATILARMSINNIGPWNASFTASWRDGEG